MSPPVHRGTGSDPELGRRLFYSAGNPTKRDSRAVFAGVRLALSGCMDKICFITVKVSQQRYHAVGSVRSSTWDRERSLIVTNEYLLKVNWTDLYTKILTLGPAIETYDRMIVALDTPPSTEWTRLAHTSNQCCCRCHDH